MATLLESMGNKGLIGKRFMPRQPEDRGEHSWTIPEGENKPYQIVSLTTDSGEVTVPVVMEVITIDGKLEKYSLERHYADRPLTYNQWTRLKRYPVEIHEKCLAVYRGELPLKVKLTGKKPLRQD